MADNQFYTSEAAAAKAGKVKAALATGKMRLFQSSMVPNATTTKDQLVAAEAKYDGYPAGGFALTAWTGPLTNPGGGAIITSPLVNVVYGPPADPPITNAIGGGWVEDTGGDVWFVFTYDPIRSLLRVGDGWQWVGQLVEGRNGPVL